MTSRSLLHSVGNGDRRLLRFRGDVDEDTLSELAGEGDGLLLLEGDGAVFRRHKGVVAGPDYVRPGMEFRPALADDDIAFLRGLSAEEFYAEAFGDGVAAELGRAACLTMCHRGSVSVTFGIY